MALTALLELEFKPDALADAKTVMDRVLERPQAGGGAGPKVTASGSSSASRPTARPLGSSARVFTAARSKC